jgi:hypothetical protein
MDQPTISLLAGLIGAVIGATASIVTVIVQAKIQDRREQKKMVFDVAINDYKMSFEMAKTMPGKKEFPPLSLFIDYHLRLNDLIINDELTPENYKELCRKNYELYESIKGIDEWRKRQA